MLSTYKGREVPIRHVALALNNSALIDALHDASEAKFKVRR